MFSGCTVSPVCPRVGFHHHPRCGECGSVDFTNSACLTCRTLRVLARQRDAAAWEQVQREGA